MGEPESQSLTLQDVPDLRRRTEGIGKLLADHLRSHLATLRPLFAPERIFGKHTRSKADVPSSDEAVNELKEKYKAFTRKPFDLPEEFNIQWVQLIGGRLELYPWEYTHRIISGQESTDIAMSSSLRWVLTYQSNCSLHQARMVLAGKEPRHPEHLRLFVLNALAMSVLVKRTKGLHSLFADLRFELEEGQLDDLPALPLTVLGSCLPSIRPSDELILAATGFSGIAAFIELTDITALREMKDPFQERLQTMVK